MNVNPMKLKARIRNYAIQHKIAAQVVLQNYMFERFLVRLSQSQFRDKFILKGGMLIANIVGLETRSTMDLDTTVRNINLVPEDIYNTLCSICNIDIPDNIVFHIDSIKPIRGDDIYGGLRVLLLADYSTIHTPLTIDISTGDVTTPAPIEYEFSGIFDNSLQILLFGYNIETILAEKIETVLHRGVFNTRMRDFYDIYILTTTQRFDFALLHQAIIATAEHRGNVKIIKQANDIINSIKSDVTLRQLWKKYQDKFLYTQNIGFENVIAVLQNCITETSKS